MIAPIVFVASLFHAPLTGLAILFVAHMLYLWPTLVARSQWWGPVYCGFATEEKEVWLTIDDGPHPEDTPLVLDLLDQHDARATFFVKGQSAERYPGLIREILRRGHQVSNHSWSHPSASFWCLPPDRIRDEIDKAGQTIEELGAASPFFRAPVGMKNSFVHPALEERNLALLGWSVRSFDSVATDPCKVAIRVRSRARPGSIVLLHEGDLASGRRGSEMLGPVLEQLAEAGFSFTIPTQDRLLTRFP